MGKTYYDKEKTFTIPNQNQMKNKKFILKILGHLSIIPYCPKHGWMKPQGYYGGRHYCPKCETK